MAEVVGVAVLVGALIFSIIVLIGTGGFYDS